MIWPVLSTDSNYVFDDEVITFTGGGNGPYYGLQLKEGTQESIFYIQAILNYWLMERLVKENASTFRGDYYSHGKQFVAALPIYKINFDAPAEMKAYKDIVKDVHTIMTLAEQKNIAQTQQKKQTIERVMDTVAKQIEHTIDSLYGTIQDDRVNI